MKRRVVKYLAMASIVAAAVSACTGLSGVHLNSQVLQGQSGGVMFEPKTPRAPDAPPAVATESLPAIDAIDEAQALAGSSTAGLPEPARTASVAPPAASAQSSAAPVSASAPSFVGTKTTVVGLGDPGREGLWMETPLVSARRNARVTAPNGKSVVVTLEPISGDEGAGSRLSIGGMRALGLPLTELVELRVGPV